MSAFLIGDIVKLKSGAVTSNYKGEPLGYIIDRALVTRVDDDRIRVKYIDGVAGYEGEIRALTGLGWYPPAIFELIKHSQPFDKAAVLKHLNDGESWRVYDYNLRGADLSHLPLAGFNFESMSLIGTNFSRSDLLTASFYLTCLHHAKFDDADLTRANLFAICACQASFKSAKMRFVNLRGSKLSCSNFEDAFLRCADMREIVARYSNFTNACMAGVKLHDSNLYASSLIGTDLFGASLGSASFKNVKLGCADKHNVTDAKEISTYWKQSLNENGWLKRDWNLQ